MNRTTIIIALVGVLVGALIIGGASGYLDYIERPGWGPESTCAGLNAFVASDLDATIEERAALLAADAWEEYLRRQGREDEIEDPDPFAPIGARAEAAMQRAEEALESATEEYRPAQARAARCTRAASLVGVRNGAIVMILGGLAVLGIARLRPGSRD